MQVLSSYLSNDRQYALVRGLTLPERAKGTALFADISGFTSLTTAFALALGPRRGAEELTQHLNAIYDALIGTISDYGGSVIGFSGDALTCWFDGDESDQPTVATLRALRCALDMQTIMQHTSAIVAPDGSVAHLSLKIGIAGGTVRRFVVGDPATQLIDVLAGGLLDRVAEAEHLAVGGEIVVDALVVAMVGQRLEIREWRTSINTGASYAVIDTLHDAVARAPWPLLTDAQVEMLEREAHAWLLPLVRERLLRGQAHFLAELRPAVALFLSFEGIDYDHGTMAGEQLDTFVCWVQHILGRYEGSLIQLTIGDKGSYLYAVFGAPVAHDDDAFRAMHAAHELLSLPGELDFARNIRIGLAQGVMWTGAYGSAARRTYGVMGDKTNLAARLMERAASDTIACDDDMYRHVGNRWQFEVLPSVQLKGKGITAAYRPIAEHKEVFQDAGAFVGRRMERERITKALDAATNGATRAIVIEGEAGIGKSRLLGTVAQMFRVRGLDALVGAGRSIEQQAPYHAWRDVFARYFELEDENDDVQRRERVSAVLADVVPALQARLPLLRELLNLDVPDNDFTRMLDVALRSENLDRLLVELLRARAISKPLIVVLEDAHWLDSRSWDLVGRAMRTLADVPVLLLLAMRTREPDHVGSDYVEQLAALPNVDWIKLEAMNGDDTLQLAAARLGVATDAVPAEVAELLRARAGGNPFFAEELMSALVESGLVRIEHDPVLGTLCNVVGDLEQMHRDLPATLQGLILSRVDRLPLDKQLTLKVASVIGPRFGVAPLLYMRNSHAAVTPRVLEEHLHDLTTRDFTDPPIEADPLYRFRHILTQEAAYQMLLFAQRRTLHRMIAEWYERAADDSEAQLAPNLPLLAYHYRYAEEPARERHYARLAGLQAARQFANAEAITYFSRALALTPADEHDARFDLILHREAAYDMQGARDPQRADLEALAHLADLIDDDRRRAEAAIRRAHYEEWTGDYIAMATFAQRALTLSSAAEWAAGKATASMRLGRSYGWRNLYDQAYEPLMVALHLAQNGIAPDVEAESLRTLGLYAVSQGKYAEAQSRYEHALSCFRDVGDRRGEALVLNNLGVVANEQGNNVLSRQWYEQALRCMYAIGDRRGEGIVYCNLGMVAHDEGDIFAAQSQYERSLVLNRETCDRFSEGITLGNLGSTSLALGEYATAQRLYEQSLRIRVEIGDRQGEGVMLGRLSNLASYQGKYAQALAYAEGSLTIARELDEYIEQVSALLFIGHASYGLGRWQDALQSYTEARDVHGDTPRIGRTMEIRVNIARAALRMNDIAQACEHVAAALPHLLNEPLEGTEDPLQVYVTCYQVLKAQADPRASAVLSIAHAYLQKLADRIDDATRRTSMLQAVSSHREIMAAWKAEQMDSPERSADV